MFLRPWQLSLVVLPVAVGAAVLAGRGESALVVFILALAIGIVTSLGLYAAFHDPVEREPAAPPAPPAEAFGPDTRIDRAALDFLPDPLLMVEPGGRIIYANRAARERFPRLPLAPHYATLFRAPAFVEAVAEAIAAGEVRAAEFTVFQGQETYLRAHVCPSGAGAPGGPPGPVLILVEDLTRDRRIEQLRSDFVANASHELRTPLASLIGYIETLQGPARDDAPARDRFLGVMARQAERMKRLVEDLLSLNQIEMSEHERPRTPCDFHDMAREAVSAVQPIAQRRGIAIAAEFAGPSPVVRADRDQMIQVFVNLIDNAMKYGAPGGPVEIGPVAPDPRWPGHAGIAVADRGPGIPREHVPRLTERFYRVSAQASREKGGTGLGLAIVKHILNRHRGELQIESAPGRGSRFTVWLPESPGASPQRQEGPAEAAPLPGR